MSYIDDRETFFTPHTPDKDTAMPTHLMTAQYVDELVYKQPGLAVVDKDGDTWGWIIDRHKGETGWVVGDTHDDRMQALRDGARVQPQLPLYCERYEFVQETTETTCADYTTERTEYPAPNPDDADDDWSHCEPHTPFIDRVRVILNDPVNPDHYRSHPSGVECIQITEHMNFNLGNTIKYVWRAGLKTDDPAEDIKKALWYLRRELSRIEAQK